MDSLLGALADEAPLSEGEEEVVEKEEGGRGKNWDLDDDLVFLQEVEAVGKVGRWEEIMHKCHGKKKATHVTESARFQKHFANINNKKRGKYFKPYTRKPFKPPKRKLTKQERDKLEFEHCKSEQHNEDIHQQCQEILMRMREEEAIKTTQIKDSRDKVHKQLKEKGEERKKIKDERFKLMQEEAEEDKQMKQDILGAIKTNQDIGQMNLDIQRQLMGLLGELVALKKQKYQHQ